MGASSERIALVFETIANLAGAQAVRAETTALGQAAQRANDTARTGALGAATAEQRLATTVNASIGAYVQYGRTLDLTNRRAVLAYREQGDALAANLARLGATEQQLNQIGAAIGRIEQRAGAAAVVGAGGRGVALLPPVMTPQAQQQLGIVPEKLRTAANAATMLSFAAATGSGSLQGMAMAAGSLTQSLTLLNRSARGNAILLLVGTAVQVGATIWGIIAARTKKAAEEAERLAKHIREQNEQLREQTDALDIAASHELQLESARGNAFRIQELQLAHQSRLRQDAIEKAFQLKDQEGNLVDLSAEQQRRKQFLLDQENALTDAARRRLALEREAARESLGIEEMSGSDSFHRRFEARLREIDLEMMASIEATGEKETAERIAEQRKRALYAETARQASRNVKTITDAMLASNNGAIKAIGAFGDAVRRIIIGARAAQAAVEAAIEGGRSLAALAVGDLRGAALHGAAAAELGAAAALGFRESLGGGGGGRGAGGGGSASPTFQPRSTEGGGSQTIVLQTVDPFSREVIAQTAYHLERGRVLRRPLYIPPTTGLTGMAA